MRTISGLTIVALLSIILIARAAAQDHSAIPEPPKETIDTYKAAIADLTIQNRLQAEWIQALRAKIIELQAQLDKRDKAEKQ